MLGLIGWDDHTQDREQELLWRSSCFPLTLPLKSGWRQRRRRKQGIALLRQYRVRSLVLAQGMEAEPWERACFAIQEEAPLRQSMAASLCRQWFWEQELPLRQAAVAIETRCITQAVVRLAEELCPQVRYLHLSDCAGRDALLERLRREYGLAAGGSPSIQLTLCMDAPAGKIETAQLPLYRGGEARQALHWTLPAPWADCAIARQMPTGALLCALWQMGVLSLREIACPTGIASGEG